MLKSAFELGLFGGETGGLGFAAGLQLGIEAGELLFDGLRRNLREDRVRLRHRSSGHDRLGLPQTKLYRSRQSATRIFRELEYSGLIVRRKQGLGKPALITLNYPSDAKLIAKEGEDAQA